MILVDKTLQVFHSFLKTRLFSILIQMKGFEPSTYLNRAFSSLKNKTPPAFCKKSNEDSIVSEFHPQVSFQNSEKNTISLTQRESSESDSDSGSSEKISIAHQIKKQPIPPEWIAKLSEVVTILQKIAIDSFQGIDKDCRFVSPLLNKLLVLAKTLQRVQSVEAAGGIRNVSQYLSSSEALYPKRSASCHFLINFHIKKPTIRDLPLWEYHERIIEALEANLRLKMETNFLVFKLKQSIHDNFFKDQDSRSSFSGEKDDLSPGLKKEMRVLKSKLMILERELSTEREKARKEKNKRVKIKRALEQCEENLMRLEMLLSEQRLQMALLQNSKRPNPK